MLLSFQACQPTKLQTIRQKTLDITDLSCQDEVPPFMLREYKIKQPLRLVHDDKKKIRLCYVQQFYNDTMFFLV
jgi:hypothetical protein